MNYPFNALQLCSLNKFWRVPIHNHWFRTHRLLLILLPFAISRLQLQTLSELKCQWEWESTIMMKTWRCACVVCVIHCRSVITQSWGPLSSDRPFNEPIKSTAKTRLIPGVISGTADVAHPGERLLLADTLGWQGWVGLVLTGISLAYVHTQDGRSPVAGVVIARTPKMFYNHQPQAGLFS